MEERVMSEFEDLIVLQDEANQPIICYEEDDIDENQIKPLDASTLSPHELHQEV